MGRYRIGNDITVVWTINDRDGAALPLKDKEVHLYYTCERGRFEVGFEVQGANKIVWNYLGREQRALGDYTLSVEILESAGKRSIYKDYCKAFTLVGRSCEEFSQGDANINEDGNIVLSSKLDIYQIQPVIPTVGSNSNWFVDDVDTGKPSTGKSAYEYAKENGYQGTESEYVEILSLVPEIAFVKGEGLHSAVLPGENNTAYGKGSVITGFSQEKAEDMGITPESTNSEIISAWGEDDENGKFSLAKGDYSHVEGGSGVALGIYSHVEGYKNIAHEQDAHAEGFFTAATAKHSHSEGKLTIASGQCSHAEGLGDDALTKRTIASGLASHAEGYKTQATGDYSHTEGVGTIANNTAEHAEGRYNVSNTNTIHSVGIGSSSERKNAHEIMQSGKHYILGVGGYDGTNPMESKDVATVIEDASVTPDWNALKNQKGFIEHKTHGVITDNRNIDKNLFVEQGIWYVYETEVASQDLILYCNVECSYDIYATELLPLDKPVHKIIRHDGLGTSCIIDTTLLDGGRSRVSIKLNDYDLLEKATFVITGEWYIGKLSDCFIPDNIVREETTDELREEVVALWETVEEGYHPNSTVGKADNLVGRGEAIPAEYSFRASGGKSIEDGTARIKTLHGNAVVWNQLIIEEKLFANNAEITKTTNGYTIVPTSSSPGLRIIDNLEPILGHTYILLCDKIGGTVSLYLNWGGFNKGIPNRIFTVTDVSKKTFTVYSYNETETFTLTSPRLVDLTKMFGAGNEPTTIEEFYSRIPANIDLNEYNEGEVIPFTAEGIKSVGDNAWDEQWRNGFYVSSSGEYRENATQICNVTPIKILPNQAYCCNQRSIGGYAFFYDKDMNYISYASLGDATFSTPSNAVWMNFYMKEGYGTTYKNDICISLAHSGYKEGQYFPYEHDIRKIDSRILEAFPNGMMPWDKVYNKNGKGYIVKGTGKVDDMASMAWSPGFGGFHSNQIKDSIKGMNEYTLSNVLCSRLATGIAGSNNMGLHVIYSGADYPYNGHVRIVGYDTLEALEASLAGVPLYYELAEPTIIGYDEPFNLDYLVWDFGTEEIVASKPSAPLKADIIYQFNAVDEIRELRQIIATMQAQIANR